MRECELADLAGPVRALRRPVPEGRAEAVRHGLDAELPEQLGDRVVAERPALRRGEYQPGPVLEGARFVEDLQRAGRQRDPVVALRLHPARGHRPGRRVEVDLVPRREPDLAGPGGRQRQELEGERGECLRTRRLHLLERGTDHGEGEGALVPAHAAVLRQRGGDRVAGGVVVAVALRDGPLHHRADPLAHAAHGLVLGVPVRDQHGHHVGGGDLVDPLAAEPLHGVVPERRPPLLLALSGVLPAFAVDGDHGLERVREGGHVRFALDRDGVAARP